MTQERLASSGTRDSAYGWLESYPAELSRTWILPSGGTLRLRPIRHDDDDLEMAFVLGLSRETAYQRLLSGGTRATPEWIRSMTHVDYRRHMAFVLTTETGGHEEFVAVGRYVADPTKGSAEFGLVVADAWQGRGVGRRLLEALLEHANSAGIQQMEGVVLSTNKAMLGLARSAGFTIAADPDDATIVQVRRALGLPSAQVH
jgi:acetyltransferase